MIETQQLVLEFKPHRQSYSRSSLPSFRVDIRNVGEGQTRVCVYMLKYRILASMTVTSEQIAYELQPFEPFQYEPFSAESVVTLGKQESYGIDIDLAQEGEWGFVRRHSQTPIIPAGHIIKAFLPGTYTFEVTISGGMAVYVGDSGVHDHNLDIRQIPHELPGGQVVEGLHRGMLECTAELTFT